MKKRCFFFALLLFLTFLFAQDFSETPLSAQYDSLKGALLTEAYNAYREGDYKSAVFLFRRVLADKENINEDTLYMLVMAGIKAGDYKTACADAQYFLTAFPKSQYAPIIKYQSARALYYMEEYERAIFALGDFCHENPSSMMYPAAIFLIGESFFSTHNFEKARPFYARILNDFPNDQKADSAKCRIDMIDALLRQKKLVGLLQNTDENNENLLSRYDIENENFSEKNDEEPLENVEAQKETQELPTPKDFAEESVVQNEPNDSSESEKKFTLSAEQIDEIAKAILEQMKQEGFQNENLQPVEKNQIPQNDIAEKEPKNADNNYEDATKDLTENLKENTTENATEGVTENLKENATKDATEDFQSAKNFAQNDDAQLKKSEKQKAELELQKLKDYAEELRALLQIEKETE